MTHFPVLANNRSNARRICQHIVIEAGLADAEMPAGEPAREVKR
ncbi:hypothetical protein [Mesorhizobium sp.]|nr:hypothetical protein [Mesorhizobium sp.]